jgi:hypothetical protein
VISSEAILKQKMDMLQTLADIEIATNLLKYCLLSKALPLPTHAFSCRFAGVRMTMHPLLTPLTTSIWSSRQSSSASVSLTTKSPSED